MALNPIDRITQWFVRWLHAAAAHAHDEFVVANGFDDTGVLLGLAEVHVQIHFALLLSRQFCFLEQPVMPKPKHLNPKHRN